jgi:NAD-dependent SIR2 family protein deacetylase
VRQEFPAKVKVAAFARAGKRCERCGFLLKPGNVIYNHRHPWDQETTKYSRVEKV